MTKTWTSKCTGNLATISASLFTLLSAQAQAQSTVDIEELTDFTTGMVACGQNNLNTVTASLKAALNADAWTGPRYLNINVWEQDFWDPSVASGGLDDTYADSTRVTVYAGHGSPGTLYFPGNGDAGCTASTASDMELGPNSASGLQSTLAVYLACEVLNVDVLGGHTAINQVRQQLGWLNDVSIGDDEPRDVYFATQTQSNKDAWLSLMAGPGGSNPATGAAEDRRPIVITMNNTENEAECWAAHERQAWGQHVVDELPAGHTFVCWEQIDSGE